MVDVAVLVGPLALWREGGSRIMVCSGARSASANWPDRSPYATLAVSSLAVPVAGAASCDEFAPRRSS